MKIDIFSLYNLLMKDGVIVSHFGPIMQEGIEGIAVSLKERLIAEDVPTSVLMSIFSIFIEQVQNILNYSAERKFIVNQESNSLIEVPTGIFILGSTNRDYFAQCGNKMKTSQVDQIIKCIKHINSLTKSELKDYYRQQRRAENENPESKGGGLGFIEIARRATAPLEYDFIKMDDEYSFFALLATLKISKEAKDV